MKPYREKHHIIPKCLGGTDDSWNIVELTYEEHIEAHLILHLLNPNHTGLMHAYYMMAGMTKKARQATIKIAGRNGGIKNIASGHLKRIAKSGADAYVTKLRSDPIYKNKVTKTFNETAKVKSKCNNCGIETNLGNLKRWHNNNCKVINEQKL